MQLNNKSYDILKFVGILLLPGVIVFINTLGDIWEWGETANKISLSVGAFGVLLGIVITWASSRYNKGEVDGGFLEVTGHDEDTGIPNLKMTVTKNLEKFDSARTIRLKVGQAPPPPVVEELEGE